MANLKKIMKDISLNEPVTVTLPAHVWIGFISAYSSTRWQNIDASMITTEAVTQVFDAVHLKEREAAMQAQSDQIQSLFTGHPPEVPPHMEEA